MSQKAEAKMMPDYHVAYVRHTGPYPEIGAAFGRLAAWAGPKGLLGPGASFIGIYHDDPQETPVDQLRSDACVTVPEGTEAEGEVQIGDIPAGLYAVMRGETKPEGIPGLWSEMLAWMQEQGYDWDTRPCYEIYLNDPETHPEKKLIMDVCGPIRKA